jgi:transitional endoplasmic reticulum ATPase
MLAAAVAHASHANFVTVPISSILKAGFGDSEKQVHELFERARACAPSIVFIDEMQSLFGSRDDSTRLGQRVVSQLLQEMDSLQGGGVEGESVGKSEANININTRSVIVMAATNVPWAIDEVCGSTHSITVVLVL